MLSASAVIPGNPKRQKQQDGLPPTWTAEELGKRTSIEQFFAVALAAWQAGRPELIRSPRLVLAHVWEGVEV